MVKVETIDDYGCMEDICQHLCVSRAAAPARIAFVLGITFLALKPNTHFRRLIAAQRVLGLDRGMLVDPLLSQNAYE